MARLRMASLPAQWREYCSEVSDSEGLSFAGVLTCVERDPLAKWSQ